MVAGVDDMGARLRSAGARGRGGESESWWSPSELTAGQVPPGARAVLQVLATVGAPSSSRKGESVAVRSRKGQPNKRLKLAAPGLGRIPFVPQRTSCAFVNLTAPAGWGAAA